MRQDKESGAKASEFGHECAAKIAVAIGAQKLSAKSNDCLLNGQRITIRCAKKATNRVGVYFVVLSRVEDVLGAFQEASGLYRILRLSKAQYTQYMDERDYGRGKMGQVTRSTFERHGALVAANVKLI